MDVTEPSSQDGPTAVHTETFCLYLAKQLVAKRGFVPGVAPEAHEIAAQSDYSSASPTAIRRSSSR
jgi:hypothetical protein